jgi:DNA polymerase (family 10)
MIVVMATTLPRNAQVAEQFDLLADLLELDGEEQFRVLAYRRAADQIRTAAGPIAELALEGEAKNLPGIGKTIESKIVQIVESGEIEALTKRKAKVPAGVAEFLRLPALGPKTARRIWLELGITTMDDLRKAAEAEQLRSLPGLGAKTEERILRALDEKPKEKRTLLAKALPAVLAVVDVLKEHPASDEVSEAGSVRRRTETVKDLDIIATASDPAALTEYFTKLKWVAEIKAHGKTKATVVSHDGLVFDLRVVPPDAYGNLLQHFTGSKRHNVELREDAVKRGLSVSEYGVKDVESGEVFTARTEGSSTSGSATRGSRPSCGRGRASWPRRGRASCPSSSSSRTCAATCTCTRRGRTTARTRSRRWRPLRRGGATPTLRSRITRTTSATAGSRRSGARSPS